MFKVDLLEDDSDASNTNEIEVSKKITILSTFIQGGDIRVLYEYKGDKCNEGLK
jgi:hypothetical protein